MADLVTLTRCFVGLFNQDFGAQPFDFSAELRAMFVAEPEVVPMRAALVGIGRETGAETGMRRFLLIEFEGDLIATARSFVNEHEAREAASR
jgi:hypothetical protein